MDSRYLQQFKKGSLEMVLLSILSKGETYGYEIMSQLNTRGGEIFGNAKEGTVYPLLYRLQDAQLIQCRLVAGQGGASRKYYSLTPRGRETYAQLQAFWREYVRCVEGFLTMEGEGEG